MPRDWKLRIEDILDAIPRIERFTAAVDESGFRENETVFYAVLANLHIIGEAAARVPEDIQRKYPEVPWNRARGLRNIIAHEYFAVDAPVIWQAAAENAPGLKPMMEKILAQEPDEGS